MLGLTPFLLFDGNCAEAMRFYHACYGGDLTLTRLGDTPMKAQLGWSSSPRRIGCTRPIGDKSAIQQRCLSLVAASKSFHPSSRSCVKTLSKSSSLSCERCHLGYTGASRTALEWSGISAAHDDSSSTRFSLAVISMSAKSPMHSMTTDEHLVASAAHCTGWRHFGYPALPREEQAMEITEYGKGGKP